ncbi:ABC transporter ATP-binding protein [Propionibacterium australiense]|uniref:ABC transporter n=1 Tax=Propionibacterium australiense TaxID=119981 RepID=A0A383SAK0_9ACTN|nr:ATP-binding cassette domain-containing protein [Propionibacterium australiense]RLP06226.1 ATP-binding cassette domain-containing protein [Propionibacterium australiense]RLP07564.1 ATP-binding cassette domain-containing protein [Propionibacterium australiense]SYZ34582.1 ABC transporter [Propionibacterium australiense]VEH92668.1 ABC-type transporter ATP-binding protein EcsA [Propionibacterium australiense]
MSILLTGVCQAYSGFELRDVSFEVSTGEIVGFLGPNGSGKSTTLRILLGLERPARGTALIEGTPYARLPQPMRTVGSILDAQWIAGGQTVTQYLTWLAIAGGLDRSRIPLLLEQVDLAYAAKRRVSRLSLGMRQRLGLAGALLGDPRYLVLDEPLNGLDPEGIRWFRDLLRQLRDQGRGILLSSHILSEVSAVADRVVMISSGRVTGSGSLSDFEAEGSLEDAFFKHLAPKER